MESVIIFTKPLSRGNGPKIIGHVPQQGNEDTIMYALTVVMLQAVTMDRQALKKLTKKVSFMPKK